MDTPLQIAIQTAKAQLRDAVRNAQQSNGLPSFLIDMILSEIKAELGEINQQTLVALYKEKDDGRPAESSN